MAVNDRTEFIVSQLVGANDLNGGGPRLVAVATELYNLTAGVNGATVDVATPTVILDLSGNKWDQGEATEVAVDDWLVWDTGGVKEHRRITDISDIGNGNITVNAVCTVLAQKAVRVGGHWATVDHAASTLLPGTGSTNAAGDPPRVNIRYAATPYQEEFQVDVAGTAALWHTFEGYFSTPSDECDDSGTLRLPHIEGPAGAALDGTCYIAVGTDYHIIRWLKITAQTNGKHAVDSTSDHSLWENLWVEASGTTARGINDAGSYNAIQNIYASATERGISAAFYTTVRGCRVVAGTIGIRLGAVCHAIGNIISGTSDDCILSTNFGSAILGNVCYGSTGGSGIKVNLSRICLVQNNICEGNNQYGIEGLCAKGVDWNFTYNNAQGAHNNTVHWGANNVAYTASAFVNAPTDMHLNNDASGGAKIRGLGWPGALIKGDHTGYLDGGALQHQDAGGIGRGFLRGTA